MRRISRVRFAVAVGAAYATLAIAPASAADLDTPDLPAAAVGAGAATAFPAIFGAIDAGSRGRAVGCLADAVYYEAGNQPLMGRQAVAQVVMNRVASPNYPKSVCEVVYQGAPKRGCQFTFACDGSLARSREGQAWRDAVAIAERSLAGFVDEAVGASDHYHTLQVHPYWSRTLTPTIRIGAHQFYRPPSLAEKSRISAEAYAGYEPVVAIRNGGGLRLARTGPVPPPPSPQAATFSVWGVAVARVVPHAGELAYAPSGT